jgi:hypothetical protein
MSHTLATCTLCDVGRRIYLETSYNKIIDTYPSISYLANRERTCTWWWHVQEIASTADYLAQLISQLIYERIYNFILNTLLKALRNSWGRSNEKQG